MKGMTFACATLLLCMVALAGCVSPPERAISLEEPPYAVLVSGKNPLQPHEYRSSKGEVTAVQDDLIRYYEKHHGHALNLLLLSGGGQNGAFGAGFLKGWQKRGTRPEFDLVTGVSTGALLATHAFLGTPADDAVLEEIFTGINSNSVYTKQSLFSVLGGADSLMNTAPLKALIAKHITSEVLARVAAEHARGRRLYVATTNLDYNQTWAWNLGLIAAGGDADALELYRQVLLASSAFPVMFPPVEMFGHLFADGAIRANLLIPGLSGDEFPGPPLYGPGHFYLVQNGRAIPSPKAVRERLADLAGTAVGEMMDSSTDGLLMRAYFAALVHGYKYHLVSVPDGVDIGSNPLAFDQSQMRAGFDAGYELGKRADPWSVTPPILGDFPDWAVELVQQKLRP